MIWCRVSTEEQARENHSLANQERACRAFAVREGLNIVAVYKGEGESAYIAKRPEWQRMLDDIISGRVRAGHLIVNDLSRFARDAGVQANALHDLRRVGCAVRSVSEPNIDDSPAGRLLHNMLGALNQFHSDAKSLANQRATQESYAAGRWPHQPPTGFRPSGTPGIPEHDPAVGPLMADLFDAVAGGESVAGALAALRSRGLRVSRTRAHYLLRQPFYAGFLVLDNGREQRGAWPALIDRMRWDRVQRTLTRSEPSDPDVSPTRTYRKFDERFPWKGTVRCGGCGGALTGDASIRGKNPKLRCFYDCRSRGAARTAECVRATPDALHVELTALLGRTVPTAPISASAIAVFWDADQEETRAKLREARAALPRIDNAQTEATKKLIAVSNPAAIGAIERHIADLDSQRVATRARVFELEAELRDAAVNREELAEAVAVLGTDLRATFVRLGVVEQAAFLRFVYPGGVTVLRAPTGFKIRTPLTANVFRVFSRRAEVLSRVASPAGFEPASPP